MSLAFPRICPLGDSALTVTLGNTIELELHQRVLRFAESVRALRLVHVREIVPAYAAVTVFYNPLYQTYADLAKRLQDLAQGALTAPVPTTAPKPGKTWEVPVRYDGPDLPAVAEARGLTEAEVVRLHTARDYSVYLLGFAPGFAYLGPLDAALKMPRRELPRRSIKPGTVAIAGEQTAIYPLATPGGWHLLGHTDLRPFDAQREPAILFSPGDTVRFVAIN